MEEVLLSLLEKLKFWSSQADADANKTVCVIAASKKQRDAISVFLERNGVLTQTIDENQNAGVVHERVFVATMHRAKGLEFDRVAVVAPKSYLGDLRDTENHRKLMYVAVSRAKRETVILIN